MTFERFPRLHAAASLKHSEIEVHHPVDIEVFRGYMPRPH